MVVYKYSMPSNILLVDDDALVRASLKRILERSGIKVTEVCSVSEAKKTLSRYLFSGVVSDVRLPDGTGVDLHEWVVEQYPYLLNKFFFCSGGMSSELEMYINESGCRFFKKPIDGTALVEAIYAVRSLSSSRLASADGTASRGL
jgi:DNA-binding NtrC family response regulator